MCCRAGNIHYPCDFREHMRGFVRFLVFFFLAAPETIENVSEVYIPVSPGILIHGLEKVIGMKEQGGVVFFFMLRAIGDEVRVVFTLSTKEILETESTQFFKKNRE